MHAAERRLPYQHDYHAGNFADVVKHTVLLLLMQRMADKESPFMYVETHAGAGSYDLRDGKAAQLNEQAAGIALLQAHAESAGVDTLPPPSQRLVEMIAADGRYPGSPRLAAELLRPQDSLLLCELAAEQHERLCRCAPIDALLAAGRARVLCADGYKAVRSRDAVQGDPRKRPRALVLVDPPYQARPASPELAAELAP
jgi:23S rRNA (adenine2030-N6)-methyltransferase